MMTHKAGRFAVAALAIIAAAFLWRTSFSERSGMPLDLRDALGSEPKAAPEEKPAPIGKPVPVDASAASAQAGATLENMGGDAGVRGLVHTLRKDNSADAPQVTPAPAAANGNADVPPGKTDASLPAKAKVKPLRPVMLRAISASAECDGCGINEHASARPISDIPQRLESEKPEFLEFTLEYPVETGYGWTGFEQYEATGYVGAALLACEQQVKGSACEAGESILVLSSPYGGRVSPDRVLIPANFDKRQVSIRVIAIVGKERREVPFTFKLGISSKRIE